MTNLVTVNNGQAVVSSRQVADNFGKLHKDVLENIRVILAAENSATKLFYKSTYKNRGKQYPEYLMNRDGFTLLAMGFNGKKALEWKLKYIQAFNEMEKQLANPFKVPQTMAEALYLAAEQAKQIEIQQHKILEDKPKVEFFNAVAESKDAISISECAKVLNMGIGRNKLFEFLRKQKVLRHNNEPFQRFVDAGYFRQVEQKWHTEEGETKISLKTLVYQKGLDYIRKLLTDNKMLDIVVD